MKKLLHIFALIAIRWDEEINAYYKRKIELDGKPKMAVINAVRNKLILRIFACMKQDRRYLKSYERSVQVENGQVKHGDEVIERATEANWHMDQE
ncbi:hypothetical protein SNE25_20305 [Mucilaginibacter sabulilitoris]|uniref:IS110 family transposase n=1 Tax=Mucilaginibacter sabulilitoris TaxID=1173583 RepID=A0ABZ0TEQ4_9SPHI|nr:hypothetical protein [Mucilaginibacter sabulilitoris]WPU91664.1 hypothetical protein SNE25_20305 [Mucilaginibacter sabulilitoris]